MKYMMRYGTCKFSKYSNTDSDEDKIPLNKINHTHTIDHLQQSYIYYFTIFPSGLAENQLW